MSRTVLIAALTAFVATPAFAAGAKEAQSTPTNESRPAANKSKATKYCLAYDKTTGSRIERTECRTKEEWAKEGIDVDNLEG